MREEMREEIIKKALGGFLSFGFKTYTMDDLSKDLGISKKTLYEMYESKTELIKECAELHIERYVNIDFEEKGNNIIEGFYNVQNDFFESFKFSSSRSTWELKKYYPELYEQLNKKFQNYEERNIEKILKSGLKQGIFREDLNIPFLKKYFHIISDIKVGEDYFPENEFTLWEVIVNFSECMFRILVNEKGKEILEGILEREHVKANRYNKI